MPKSIDADKHMNVGAEGKKTIVDTEKNKSIGASSEGISNKMFFDEGVDDLVRWRIPTPNKASTPAAKEDMPNKIYANTKSAASSFA